MKSDESAISGRAARTRATTSSPPQAPPRRFIASRDGPIGLEIRREGRNLAMRFNQSVAHVVGMEVV